MQKARDFFQTTSLSPLLPHSNIFAIPMNRLNLLLPFLLFSFFSNAQTQNALHFDGTNDFVQTRYDGVSGKANRTFEAWIYLTATPSGNTCILDYGQNAVGSRNTFIVNANRAIGYISGGTNANITSSSSVVALNQWVHVAFVLNSGTGYLYVDGKQVGTGNLSTVNTPTTGTNLRIGQRVPGGSIPFGGTIDEVRVWDYALTSNELDSLNNMEICPNASGLVAYYRFNQGSAGNNNAGRTTLPDKVNSSHNGTLNNFALSGSTSNWVQGVSITAAPDTSVTIDTSACGTFTSPQGNKISSNGTVEDTYASALGCDSVVKYNVTIKGKSFVYDEQEACDSFRTAKGVLKTTSDIYSEVFTNAAGCDSTVQTLLTIYKSATIQQNIETCYSYTSSTGEVWTQSGLYYDSLQSVKGCDSILAINLTIRQATSAVVYDTACSRYTGPLGNVYTQSGTYQETIRNQYECDSVVTLNLVINKPSDTTLNVQGCDSFTSSSGRNTWFSSGLYTEDFQNIKGCDSTVKYNVVITSATNGSTALDACDFYITPNQDTITQSGEYTFTITNTAGCDSMLTVDLRIVDNKPTLSLENNVLRTQTDFEAYEWLNCDEGFEVVPNASNFSYRPKVSGDYAVVVYDAGCPDTSDCFNYPRTASVNAMESTQGNVYPNPVGSMLFFSATAQLSKPEFVILNSLGQIVARYRTEETKNNGFQYILSVEALNAGSYTLQLRSEEGIRSYPFIKL
jgi:Tfp pilus assembly protein PilE